MLSRRSFIAAQIAAGEEWQRMITPGAPYQPQEHAAALAAAERRIREIRMRDAAFDLNLPQTMVRVEQVSHSFPFGNQLWAIDADYRHGRWDSPEARARRDHHARLFNAANALCYWTERPQNDASRTEDRQGEPKIENFAACVSWAESAGLIVKGHPLYWPIPKAVPAWVSRYDLATQMKFLEVRVRNLVARFHGRVKLWDVTNELLWEPPLAELPSRSWPHLAKTAAIAAPAADVIRWCRFEDPKATLVMNDYGLEADSPKSVPKAKDGTPVTAALQRRRFLELIAELRRRGAAPDALGTQSHTGTWLSPAAQLTVYDELAQSGLPIHITEYGPPPNVPDEYSANFLTVAFSHPSVEAFFFWYKLSDRAVDLVRGLIHEKWKTRLDGRTDEKGVLRFRGFRGRYVLHLPGGERREVSL